MLVRGDTKFCSCTTHLLVQSISSMFEHCVFCKCGRELVAGTSCGWSFTELHMGVQHNYASLFRKLYYSTKSTSTQHVLVCTVTIFTPLLQDWQQVFILTQRRSEEMAIAIPRHRGANWMSHRISDLDGGTEVAAYLTEQEQKQTQRRHELRQHQR